MDKVIEQRLECIEDRLETIESLLRQVLEKMSSNQQFLHQGKHVMDGISRTIKALDPDGEMLGELLRSQSISETRALPYEDGDEEDEDQ